MALADYQNALLRLQGTPSSVRAISNFDEPLRAEARAIGSDVVSQRNLSNNIARMEDINRLDAAEFRAMKDEYKAAVPMEMFNVGMEWWRGRERKAKDILRDKEEARYRRRTDALIEALTGWTQNMRNVYMSPIENPVLPSPYIYPTTQNPSMAGAISSKLGGNYGGGGY